MDRDSLQLPEFETLQLTPSMLRDLRSDHAGETGAVYIYRGILQQSHDPEIVTFARAHLATEAAHLELLHNWLPPSCRSRLLPLWRFSGWLLGTLSAKAGRATTFATIAAVEQFVVVHYQAQIDKSAGSLRALLITLQRDEAAHRDDATRRLPSTPWWRNLWARVIHGGSAAAVSLARWL